jgi:hypothetical protein
MEIKDTDSICKPDLEFIPTTPQLRKVGNITQHTAATTRISGTHFPYPKQLPYCRLASQSIVTRPGPFAFSDLRPFFDRSVAAITCQPVQTEKCPITASPSLVFQRASFDGYRCGILHPHVSTPSAL